MVRGRLNGARRNRVRKVSHRAAGDCRDIAAGPVFRSATAGAHTGDRYGGRRARSETACRSVRLLSRRQRARWFGRPRPDAVDPRSEPTKAANSWASSWRWGVLTRDAEVRHAAARRCRISRPSCTPRSTRTPIGVSTRFSTSLSATQRPAEAYFNGAGRCNSCHSPSKDLEGVGAKYEPATLQGRLLLPRGRERARRQSSGSALRRSHRSDGDGHASIWRAGLRRAGAAHRFRGDALRRRRRAHAIVAAKRRHAEGRGDRSAAGAHGPPDEVDGRRHAQHDGLSCELEMTTMTPFGSELRALPVRRGTRGGAGHALGQIPTDSWPTYHGDYSGRRFSTLKQINTTNVKGLTLAWVYRLNLSRAGAIVGGEGPGHAAAGDPAADQVDAADDQRHPVLLGARPRLGARRAHRAARTGTTPGRRAAAITSATAASASSTTGCTSSRRTTTSSRSTWRPARSDGITRSPT